MGTSVSTAREGRVEREEAARARSAEHYLRAGVPRGPLQTLAALASRSTGWPVAMVTLIDGDTQYPLAQVGLHVPPLPRQQSLCERVVAASAPVTVTDARVDVRFRDHPAVVSAPHVRAYAGVPLVGREGLTVGSLCLLDTEPHELTSEVLCRLEELAEVACEHLEHARRRAALGLGAEGLRVDELRRALEESEFQAWYQPVVSLDGHHLQGFEALARWVHPTRGVLPPSEFLPLAEDTDLVVDLDRRVLSCALGDLARWRERDPRLRMAVNVSAAHLRRDDLAEHVLRSLAAAELPATVLTLELTESALTAEGGTAGAQLDLLRAAGCRVHLDDFGTGWNSLEYLLRLPVDGVKVDRVFAAALGTRLGDALVRGVVALASDLELALVVEGVETDAQAAHASRLGCVRGQGFLWGAPAPRSVVEQRWLAGSAGEAVPQQGWGLTTTRQQSADRHVVTVRPAGRLTATQVPELVLALRSAFTGAPDSVVCDLTDLQHAAPTCLHALVGASWDPARDPMTRFEVRGARGQVAAALRRQHVLEHLLDSAGRPRRRRRA